MKGTSINGIKGKLKSAESSEILDSGFKRTRASKVEKRYEMSVMWISLIAVVIVSAIFMAIGVAIADAGWGYQDFFCNMGCNVLALFIVVVCLDALVNKNRDARVRRDETRKILRYNRLISPEIDMYLVRKNMVITPNDKSVRKFQVKSKFTVRDMRDMYGQSELVSDVGISKIRRYAYYQNLLKNHFESLITSVDFTNYPEIADAAMRYLNATSYGEAALAAVVSYEDMRVGNKSMKSAVVSMMKEEPESGSFITANPTMKNVYLVHQMICDQEKAVADYTKMIKILQENDTSGYTDRQVGEE